MNIVHNLCDPGVISLNESRNFVSSLSIREQILNVGNTVLQYSILKTSVTLSISHDLFHISVGKNFLLVVNIVFKNVVFHIVVSSFIIIAIFIGFVIIDYASFF